MKITVFTSILLSIACLVLVVDAVAKASIGDHTNVVLALVMAHWIALKVGWLAYNSSIWRGYNAAWEAYQIEATHLMKPRLALSIENHAQSSGMYKTIIFLSSEGQLGEQQFLSFQSVIRLQSFETMQDLVQIHP